MSQKIKEFVRQSGVDVTNSNSNENKNFARELEEDLLRADREQGWVPYTPTSTSTSRTTHKRVC